MLGDIIVGKASVLIVEDDLDIQQLLSYNLIKSGLNVSCADSGEEALELLEKEKFDIVLLDIMLPGKDGVEVCSIIRNNEKNCELPVIMLTAKGEDDDIVHGLSSGADDYVVKPFSPKVVVARVQAVLRRKHKNRLIEERLEKDTITIRSMVIHRGRHEVIIDGVQVSLTPTEFTILEQLAERPGWVFTRQQIIDKMRGYDYIITPRAVDVQIFGLRKKLGPLGEHIETVRGIGYRLREEEESYG